MAIKTLKPTSIGSNVGIVVGGTIPTILYDASDSSFIRSNWTASTTPVWATMGNTITITGFEAAPAVALAASSVTLDFRIGEHDYFDKVCQLQIGNGTLWRTIQVINLKGWGATNYSILIENNWNNEPWSLHDVNSLQVRFLMANDTLLPANPSYKTGSPKLFEISATIVYTQPQQEDTVPDPTEPVVEYEGTKGNIFVFDAQDELVAVLDSKSYGGCPYFNDLHTVRIDGTETYDFEVPAEHPDALYLAPNNMLLISDNRRVNHLLVIKTVDEKRDENTHIKIIHSEVSAQELNYEIVNPINMVGMPVAEALTTILEGSRWDAGSVDWAGIVNINFKDYPTKLAALKQLTAYAGLEMRYRVGYQGSKITGRYIDLVTEVGEDRGRVIEYGKDIKGIVRTGDSNNLCTALIGLGKGNNDTYITFADIVEGDKPAGQNWIGDEEALLQFGLLMSNGDRKHRFGTVIFDDETDPSRLLARTRVELAKRKQPQYSYDVDIAMLDRAPQQTPWGKVIKEPMAVGDWVTVRDKTFSPPLHVKIRVSELRRSYTNPSGNESMK